MALLDHRHIFGSTGNPWRALFRWDHILESIESGSGRIRNGPPGPAAGSPERNHRRRRCLSHGLPIGRTRRIIGKNRTKSRAGDTGPRPIRVHAASGLWRNPRLRDPDGFRRVGRGILFTFTSHPTVCVVKAIDLARVHKGSRAFAALEDGCESAEATSTSRFSMRVACDGSCNFLEIVVYIYERKNYKEWNIEKQNSRSTKLLKAV